MEKLGIGKKITQPQERDAIHVAVIPMVAGKALEPGEHVSLDFGGVAVPGFPMTYVGVVDPFLRGPIEEGERFWLFLYPGSITSLRHDWTHPAFEKLPSGEEVAEAGKRGLARLWIAQYAEAVGKSTERLLSDATVYLDEDQTTLLNKGEDLPDVVYDKAEEFWKNYELMTGIAVPAEKKRAFYYCSC